MKKFKTLLVLTLLLTGVLTSCTKQELNEDNPFKNDFQGVDKSIQRPGTQNDSGN